MAKGVFLTLDQPDFEARFSQLLHSRESQSAPVGDAVKAIIADVRTRGDDALIELTSRYDGWSATADTLRLSVKKINDAADNCPTETVRALEVAAARLHDYHSHQTPHDMLYADETGTTLGWRWTPVDAVGLYVPGGRASYPSSVLHNAIPARAAGVKRLAMVVPTPQGELSPAVMAAARVAQIDEIYAIGGAQAIAALAYGTSTVTAVDKIVGPGNAYVAEAKRQVFGTVGIDMIAGPSEILVVADALNNPQWIAADLLSQAEHDPNAQSILITNDAGFATQVDEAIEALLPNLLRREVTEQSWRNHGAIIVVDDWSQSINLINRITPEHLELAIENPSEIARFVRHAGAIFMGRFTPEAIGDYLAGPSHVLPTSRTARFSSGLSVYEFVKKTSIIGCTQSSLRAIGGDAVTLAQAEGLECHSLSVSCRITH